MPLEWNWLVGEYEHKDDVNNVHYTKGGPWFEEYAKCDYSQDWFKNLEESNGSGFETRDNTDVPVRALVESAKGHMWKKEKA